MVFTLFAAVWPRVGKDSETDEEGKRPTDADAKGDESTSLTKSMSPTRVLFVAGLIAGLLPLFHMHAYFSENAPSMVKWT